MGGVPVSLCGIRIGSESEGGGLTDEVTGTFGLPRYLIGALIATACNVRLPPKAPMYLPGRIGRVPFGSYIDWS